jgi:hypothetical protein
VVFAANLAIEFGFRLAVDSGLWSAPSLHANYSDFRKILRLTHLPSDLELRFPPGANISRYTVHSREEFIKQYHLSYSRQCHMAVKVLIASGTGCLNLQGQAMYCFSCWPGAYRRARRLVQRAIMRAPSSLPEDTALFHDAWKQQELVIAWHLLCGDIVLPASHSFFTNIRAYAVAAGVPVRDFVFRNDCSDFDYVQEVLPSAVVVIGSADDAMRHMAAADILVHTGSSMAATAFMVAAGPQLFLQSPPMEGMREGMGAFQTFAQAGMNVIGPGDLLKTQSFRFSGRTTPSHVDSDEGIAHGWQVVRYIRAIYARRYPLTSPGRGGPWADVEARELDDLLGYKVVSGVLVDPTVKGLLIWEQVATIADQVLPGWLVRVHYDSRMNFNLCGLRALQNVELIDMASSRLTSSLWAYAPAMEDEAVADVFVGAGAGLSMC